MLSTIPFICVSYAPRLSEALEIVFIGCLLVFGVLLLLSLMTSMIGAIFARLSVDLFPDSVSAETGLTKSPETLLIPDKESSENFDSDETDPHIIAVIAAAVHCAMDGRKHRIISVRSSDSNWAAEGRRQIFSSRKVR